jgi:outer membrane protein assembly factor BamD
VVLAGAMLAAVVASACASRETPLTELTPQTVWEQGVEHFNAERWDDAIRHFDHFQMVGGADPLVHQARYYSAEAHFKKREYLSAASRFTALAGDLGRAELAAQSRFMACRSYEELAPRPQLDQEYTRAAIDHCQALADFFPDHHYADEARQILDRMWHRLAAKTYEGGEWYQRRRALDSALIYYQDVVRLYPRTSYAPRALRRMMEIYETLDYQDELEETRQRLLSSYPDSPQARAVAGGGSGERTP